MLQLLNLLHEIIDGHCASCLVVSECSFIKFIRIIHLEQRFVEFVVDNLVDKLYSPDHSVARLEKLACNATLIVLGFNFDFLKLFRVSSTSFLLFINISV